MEKSGIKLFKRDLKIADATGENFVIVQVASEDKSILDDYVSNTKFSLSLIKDISQLSIPKNASTVSNNLPIQKIDLYDVVLFKRIDSQYKGYTINHARILKSMVNSSNARIRDAYASTNFHQSNQFDDWMTVTRFDIGQTELSNGMTVKWQYRSCAFCGWTDGPSDGLYEGNNVTTYNQDARRLSCEVHHNYSNYNVSYGNY